MFQGLKLHRILLFSHFFVFQMQETNQYMGLCNLLMTAHRSLKMSAPRRIWVESWGLGTGCPGF